ncbi:MAG: Hsp33 family molecular chaperone HslO, partial [Azoarcus sp.]|nr:Hsp33 family molecular chaperone HslO [Azoarcus sp.]
EDIRLYIPRAVIHDWPADPEKIAAILRAMGEKDVRAVLATQGAITVRDELSNHTYHFDKDDIDMVFKPRTLH